MKKWVINKKYEKTFKTNNISCMSCSNLIKGSLEDSFGEIEVNLNTSPKKLLLKFNRRTRSYI